MSRPSELPPEFAPKHIECHSTSWIAVSFTWLFGFALTLIALCGVVRALWKMRLIDAIGPVVFLLLLLAIAVAILRNALFMTRQLQYASGATLDLTSVPAVGGQVQGVVRHPRLETFSEYDVVLACRPEFTENDSAPAPSAAFRPDGVLWHEQQRVAVIHDEQGAAIPVSFQIPAKLPPSRHYWQLEARPPLPGVVLFFFIPVFRPRR